MLGRPNKLMQQKSVLILTLAIITITIIPITISAESEIVPTWIKNTAGWWADGLVSDSEFVSGLEHLVNNGVI